MLGPYLIVIIKLFQDHSSCLSREGLKCRFHRRVSMMNCSVWLLISIDSKAAIVTSAMTAASYCISPLIRIFCVVIAISFHGAVWSVPCHFAPIQQHFWLVVKCVETIRRDHIRCTGCAAGSSNPVPPQRAPRPKLRTAGRGQGASPLHQREHTPALPKSTTFLHRKKAKERPASDSAALFAQIPVQRLPLPAAKRPRQSQ